MKKLSTLILALTQGLAILAADITPSESFPTYYADIDNTSGEALFAAIHSIAAYGDESISYSDLWTAFSDIDVKPDGTMYDYYSCTTTYTPISSQCGNYKGEGDCYNREHSIPKSWFGGSTGNGTPGSDLFHLFPTDGYVNNRRSNYAFGEVKNIDYESEQNYSLLGSPEGIAITNVIIQDGTYTTSASPVFEPNDEYKGDFARAYMGTMLRWAGDYTSFTSGDGASIFTSSHTAASNYGLTNYGVALLMKWHRQDTVSAREIERNNGIQKHQGNRNPFVDYPELAEYLWGAKAGQTVRIASLVAFSNEGLPVDPIEPTSVCQTAATSCSKQMIKGHLYILLNGKLYDVVGRRVR